MAEVSNKLIATPAAPLIPEVVACPQCGVAAVNDSTFCYKCGANISQPMQTQATLAVRTSQSVMGRMTQMFGLHPIVTFAALAIDWMLFGEEAATLMVGWAIAIPVALVLGVGVAYCQRYMYGDSWGAAFGKAVMVALLTAIPTAIPTFLLLPSGGLGVVKSIRGLKSQS